MPIIEKYYHLRLPDTKITEYVLEAIDQTQYGISVKTVKRLRKKHGLLSTRQQVHTDDAIAEKVFKIRESYPTAGVGELLKMLDDEYGMRVSNRAQLISLLRVIEPAELAGRKGNKLKRKRFWATGVNDVWAFDQHDKWKRFGLLFHVGVEVYSGRVLWLKVWWSNRTPALLASYYFGAVRDTGGVPLLTQSDPGKEAVGIANAHTVIRQHHDVTLLGSIQHRWKRKPGTNVKPEIFWSGLRRGFSPGFEDCLEDGFIFGWYDADDNLHILVFRWLAIPWIQRELDSYRHRRNTRLPRSNKKKFLPHGIPDLIFERPDRYGAQDFKVLVDPAIVDATEARFAPSDHPVFELVPAWFKFKIEAAYAGLNAPVVSVSTFWETFRALLRAVSGDLTPEDLHLIHSRPREDDEAPADFFEPEPGGAPWPDELGKLFYPKSVTSPNMPHADADDQVPIQQPEHGGGGVLEGEQDGEEEEDEADLVGDEIPWAVYTDDEEDNVV
ncbi:hypothetical protein EXIGLDRAFT_798661 [Exidia glandulosa HHB12029]|uniref:Integrase core domain-containing protein n=1 Tax=Exidia glandulosa HHB12029 TaxID=1314781 RepID=A0A166A4K1_EXIGL|nr:hypothetical protein EXIGLDRAFT_798661 [Exidia glandulosa HHB12029]